MPQSEKKKCHPMGNSMWIYEAFSHSQSQLHTLLENDFCYQYCYEQGHRGFYSKLTRVAISPT